MIAGVDYIGVSIVFACHDGKGNYLLHKRSDNCRDEHGRWDCGSGELEFGENVADTLKKEIKEEFCTDVLDYEFLGFRDVHRTHQGKKTHWIAIDFKVHIDRNKVKNGEPKKFEKLGWFKIGDLPEPRHSQLPEFLDKYESNLRG
ncbi:MAG: NUDIX domain-containing protein [Candidatus Woesearchaeota archaeon]